MQRRYPVPYVRAIKLDNPLYFVAIAPRFDLPAPGKSGVYRAMMLPAVSSRTALHTAKALGFAARKVA